MKHLGIQPTRPRIAVFDMTGCEGCELQFANKEESLGAFLSSVEVVRFRQISSEERDDYDVAFIDGCITRADEVERLHAIRKRAKLLVALGSCASFGGVNRQKNGYDLERANREVYGDQPKETLPTRAVAEVVEVDLCLPGCPVSKEELERAVRHLVLGVDYRPPGYPVCVECKQRFVSCVFEQGQLCLGAISRAGCQAPCPAGGLGCWGCRGPAADANIAELRSIAAERGFSEAELEERLGFFGGFEEARCKSR